MEYFTPPPTCHNHQKGLSSSTQHRAALSALDRHPLGQAYILGSGRPVQAGGGGGGGRGIDLRPDSVAGIALFVGGGLAGAAACLYLAWLTCKCWRAGRRRPPPPPPARCSSAVELARMLPSR